MADSHDRPPPAPGGDANKAVPKAPGHGFGRKLLEVLVAFVLILVGGSIVSNSIRIGRAPWAWSSEDWQGYVSFSQEKVERAKARLEQVDWSNVRTKITENTRALWDQSPDVLQRIEERLGIAKKPAGAAGTSDRGSAPVAGDPPELTAGLAALRAGIGHYRASPTDQAELLAAKKCFEEAQGHLEKAVTQVTDERQRAEVQDDLRTCNKYLEDCRSREKS